MHKSKLPYRYWFIAMSLLTSMKKHFSAKEIQRQLNHNRYTPIYLADGAKITCNHREGK